MPITNTSDELPLIGYPGPGFAGIHVTGLVCLSVSTVVSSGLLCYLCVCIRHPAKRSGSRKKRFQTPKIENQSVQTVTSSPPSGRRKTKGEQEQRQQIPEIVVEQSDAKDAVNLTQNDLDNAPSDGTSLTSSRNRIDWSTSELDLPRKTFERSEKTRKGNGIPFWKWNIGERIFVYLAICDFGFSATDISNHAYLYFMVRHPPDVICTAIGFLIHEFILSQAVVVLFMAMSACMQVVFGRRIKLGRWDHRLIALAFGVPFVIGLFCAGFGLLGQSGAWCLFDLRNSGGRWYLNIVSIIQTIIVLLLSITYAAIWIKISRTARQVNESWTTDRYQNSARIMMLFVVMFILQWWSTVMYSVWSWFEPPPIPVFIVLVAFVALGGVYNLFAYTIVRRRLLNARKLDRPGPPLKSALGVGASQASQ